MRVQDHKDTVIQDLFELKAIIKPAYILTITAIGPVVSIFLMGETPLLIVEVNYEESSNQDFDDTYKLVKSKIDVHALTNKPQTEQRSSLLPVVYSPNSHSNQVLGAAV
jgi:hypothetical protein